LRDHRTGIGPEDLALLRQGDRGAFRRVYEATVGLVAYVATRAGLAREEADEVIQETFLRLHERAGEIRDAAGLKSWLAVTARNQALDRLRKRARQRTAAAGEDLEAAAVAELWDRGGALRELEVAVVRDLLDEIAREPGGETLRLFYADGLAAKEIAARNGEAVSTVTTRLSRLRAKLGERLRARIEELRERLPEGKG
jgi:RNA polymerase sigma-70 factor (ECF subfamily)